MLYRSLCERTQFLISSINFDSVVHPAINSAVTNFQVCPSPESIQVQSLSMSTNISKTLDKSDSINKTRGRNRDSKLRFKKTTSSSMSLVILSCSPSGRRSGALSDDHLVAPSSSNSSQQSTTFYRSFSHNNQHAHQNDSIESLPLTTQNHARCRMLQFDDQRQFKISSPNTLTKPRRYFSRNSNQPSNAETFGLNLYNNQLRPSSVQPLKPTSINGILGKNTRPLSSVFPSQCYNQSFNNSISPPLLKSLLSCSFTHPSSG